MEELTRFVVGSAFLLVGFATAAFFILRISQAVSSTRWPFVHGQLESSELSEVVYGRGARGNRDSASALVVNFRYRYQVADKEYRGTRVTFSDGVNKTTGALRKLQDKYQGCTHVQVHYYPGNPQQSVLVPGLSIFNITPLITSGLFVAAGVFIMTFDFS